LYPSGQLLWRLPSSFLKKSPLHVTFLVEPPLSCQKGPDVGHEKPVKDKFILKGIENEQDRIQKSDSFRNGSDVSG
jgi:hypothetical protein